MRLNKMIAAIRRHFGQNGVFLMTLVALMAIRPFLREEGVDRTVTDLLFMSIFLSGIYSVRREQYRYWFALLLGVVVIFARLREYVSGTSLNEVLINTACLLFFLQALSSMANYVWAKRNAVDGEVLAAAVTSYLLIGFVWAYLFELLEIANPNSFRGSSPQLNQDDFFYYSFVTLGTLGYGDIVPISRPARAMSILEALFGQLYLAVLIARLVGGYMSPKSRA